ncbi:MAG: hypothetical protein M1820_005468 [Bogoriella megaspora]|nr:MAG: hypothetical protein M1820_005468 [Bogoriella megaspora]
MANERGLFYVQELPIGMRIAQVVGITSAAFLAGSTANFSFAGIPTILAAPESSRPKLWHTMFNIGKKSGPGVAVVGSLAFVYLAARFRVPFSLYTASAILLPSIVPYTYAFIGATNVKLLARLDNLSSGASSTDAAEKGVRAKEETDELLKRWGQVNWGRVVLVGAAAVSGLWAAVSRPEIVGFTKIGN